METRSAEEDGADRGGVAEPDFVGGLIQSVFFDLSLDWWERACFELAWMQHGGSGLHRSYIELLAMPLDHIQRDLTRVFKRREDEAHAIREARRGH